MVDAFSHFSGTYRYQRDLKVSHRVVNDSPPRLSTTNMARGEEMFQSAYPFERGAHMVVQSVVSILLPTCLLLALVCRRREVAPRTRKREIPKFWKIFHIFQHLFLILDNIHQPRVARSGAVAPFASSSWSSALAVPPWSKS